MDHLAYLMIVRHRNDIYWTEIMPITTAEDVVCQLDDAVYAFYAPTYALAQDLKVDQDWRISLGNYEP